MAEHNEQENKVEPGSPETQNRLCPPDPPMTRKADLLRKHR
jgi:hypothetical protein